jgi:phosphoserine phosphatase
VNALPPRCDDAPPPYGTVVFDCDSTLSSIEGVDELGAITGVGREAIAALTERAMAGAIPLEKVYGERLELLKPDRAAVEELGRRYVQTALPHARELTQALLALGKRVFIMSGGLTQAVQALAEHIGLPPDQVLAVEAFHDRAGRYRGFDELSPLTRSQGKLELLREIARADRGGGVAFVGDGATDLEAAPAARRFIAYAGVVRRPAVLERAAVHCDRPDLAALLPLLVTADEAELLTSFHGQVALVRAGFSDR